MINAMKYLVILLLFSKSFLVFSDNGDKTHIADTPIQTNKLYITVFEKNNWLKFYELQLNRGLENIIPITANFNLDNVESVMITDSNAIKKICGQKQSRSLLLLNFKQSSNNRKYVKTYINKPCIDNNKAEFKLTVKTRDGSYYYNTTTLAANKNAFSVAHHANYDEKRKPYKTQNNNNNLKFDIKALEDTPEAWNVVDEPLYPGKEITIPVSIDINIKNVNAIKIDDINAHNYKCHPNSPINLLNLSFLNKQESSVNLTTRIPTPCVNYDNVKLQISAQSINDKKYYKVINIPSSKLKHIN